jgi:hypothetical protein
VNFFDKYMKTIILSLLLLSSGCMNDKNLGYGHFKNDVKNNQIQLVIK